MIRSKRPVTVRHLMHARMHNGGRAGGPLRAFARFDRPGGLKAVEDRSVLVTMSLPEVAELVGAIPLAIMDAGGEDLAAVRRVMALLEAQPVPPELARDGG